MLLAVTSVYADDATIALLKQEAVTATRVAAVGLGGIMTTVTGDDEALSLIRAFIEDVRFLPDRTGYFFVYTNDGVNVAHATQKDLIGKNLIMHQGSRGLYDIQALVAAARDGGGFAEYYWVKPGEQGEYRKLGYVEPIPGTAYFIRAGIYLP